MGTDSWRFVRGLMKYCARCLYPENHPLTIYIDEKGVCSGCRVHEEKFDSMNWGEKEKEFGKILENYKGKEHPNYDCIIPVTGTGDDFYVVDLIKNKFKLNPLLVSYNTHYSTEIGIRNLSRLCTKLDCDHILYTVGPDTVKEITKYLLKEEGHVYWHVLAGHLTFPVQVGTKLNIPLIIWGVHPWSDQMGMFSHFDIVEMTKKVRKEHGLKMIDADSLRGKIPNISEKDLMAFTYPSDKQLEECAVRGLYVSNFFHWDSQAQIERIIEKFGYETEEQERTFNTYETVHCNVVDGVHDYLKLLKFGYGKATDHACRDIRLKRMSRKEGLELVEKYDELLPSNISKFCEWLKLSEEEFHQIAESFRNKDIWGKVDGVWKLKFEDKRRAPLSEQEMKEVSLEVNDPREYIKTSLLEPTTGDFILTGRGYMDENNFEAIKG